MSSPKTLAESALRCLNILKDMPMHERFAVLNLMNGMLVSEQKTIELEELVNKVRAAIVAPLAPADEHYQQ
jgi:hypothetical protein